MKLIWKPVTECDDDNGSHTVWSAEKREKDSKI